MLHMLGFFSPRNSLKKKEGFFFFGIKGRHFSTNPKSLLPLCRCLEKSLDGLEKTIINKC
jgi:hypothetical protein